MHSRAMNAAGPYSFMGFLGSIHTAITLFGLWRMMRSDPVPMADQQHYPAMAPRGTQLAVGIASATTGDAPDLETTSGQAER